MNRVALPLGLLAGWALISAAAAASPDPFDYHLAPRAVSDGVYVLEGRRENFSRANGGDIVNTGFIETDAGAVVIDPGPSRRYGEQLRAAVRRQSAHDAVEVLVTHAHPDHFLGAQAFDGIPVSALPATITAIARSGEALSSNLYRMVGGWMEGTEPRVPSTPAQAGERHIGGRTLVLLALSGHTDGDLAVYDAATKTLFAGDLVFLDRTPTTPDADFDRWLSALDTLEALDVRVLVPGHGRVAPPGEGIAQTRAYLRWLRGVLRDAASRGLDANETMRIAAPPEFSKLAVFDEEFQRSVLQQYPAIEAETLRKTQK